MKFEYTGEVGTLIVEGRILTVTPAGNQFLANVSYEGLNISAFLSTRDGAEAACLRFMGLEGKTITWNPSTRWTTGYSGTHETCKRLSIDVYWDLEVWCYQITLCPFQMKETPLCRGMKETPEAAKQACEEFLKEWLERVLKQFKPECV